MILCQTHMAITKMIMWFGMTIIVMVTITKFMFICVWKSMRQMNDDLIVRIAVTQALFLSFFIGLLKISAQVSNKLTCTVTENEYGTFACL